MAEGAYARWGMARTYALIFGMAYLAVAATEAITRDALEPVLEFTGIQNAIHWAVGAVVFLSFLGSEATAKMVVRVVGVVFVAISAYGFISPDGLGDVLGFSSDIPVSYDVVHALTAAIALYVGFATRRSSGRVARRATGSRPYHGRMAIAFTGWATEILQRTHAAARRFNPDATVRLHRVGDGVEFALTDERSEGDELVGGDGFELWVQAGLEGTVDVVEPHDQLILRPPGDPERSVRPS